jgi:hypothetical protein
MLPKQKNFTNVVAVNAVIMYRIGYHKIGYKNYTNVAADNAVILGLVTEQF